MNKNRNELAINPRMSEGRPGNPYRLYREVVLGGLPDEQIVHAICEGHPVHTLHRFHHHPLALRAHASKMIGKLEREHCAFIPEWAAECQALLVETVICPIEATLFGRVQRSSNRR